MPDSLPSCKLCNITGANETGSHLLTAWLIASAFDNERRGRDYEIIYKIDNEPFNFPYFGRSVPPEKIEQNIGRELHESEKDTQKNMFVEDNIFCKTCEKRLKTIEDAFLNKVHNNLNKEKIKNEANKFNNCKELKDNLIIRLFFYSLVWRISVSKSVDFKLTVNLENKLRKLLNDTLELDLKKTTENMEKLRSKIVSLPLIIIKLEKTEHPTEMPVLFKLKYKKPFSFIINDYVILLYEKKEHLRSVPQKFFGITNMINQEQLLNYNESLFKVGFLGTEQVHQIIKNIVCLIVELDFSFWKRFYREAFKKRFGEYPDESYTQKFFKELTDNDKKIGIKRTRESILEAMNKSLR
ncbi:MAG TPA: hypothetical protein VMW01_08205 [Williamwhitmania sp.]|nr:hypothetical protein [Williamwhitmania sp.]